MEEGEEGGGGDDGGSTHPVRLFVGGLPSFITEEELLTRFSIFGCVTSIEIVPSKDVAEAEANGREKIPCRGFAYIDFVPQTDNSLQKCLSLYNGCKWKGGRMRVEKAREHFMVRLQKEWAEAASEASAELPSNSGSGEFTEADARDAASGKGAPSMVESQRPRLAPLNLVWSSWPFCKRTRVVPADGGRGCGRHKRSFERLEPVPLRAGVADGPPKRRPGAGRDWEEERDWYGGTQEATEEHQRQQRRRVDDAQPDIGGIADMDVELDPEVVPSPVDVAEEEDEVAQETAAERTRQLALLASMFPEAEPAKAEGVAIPGPSVVRSHKLTSFVPVPRYDPANPNQTLIPSVVNPEHGDLRVHPKNSLPVAELASLKGVKDGPVQHKGVVMADNGFKVASDKNGKVAKEGKFVAGLEGGAPAVKSKPMSPWERALAVAAGTLVEEEEEEDELDDEEEGEEGEDVAGEEVGDDVEEEMEEEEDQGGEENEMEDKGIEEREEMGGGEIGVERIEQVEVDEDEEEEVEEEKEDAEQEEEDEVKYEDEESEQEEEEVIEKRERNGDEEEWCDANEEEVVVERRDRNEDAKEGDDDDKLLDGDQHMVEDVMQGREQGGFGSDDSLSEETLEDMEEAEDATESGGNGSLWDRALAAAAGDDVKTSSRLTKIGRLGKGAAASASNAVKGVGAADEEGTGLVRRDRKRKRREEDEVDAEEDFGKKRYAQDPRTSVSEQEEEARGGLNIGHGGGGAEEPATTGEDRKTGSNNNLPVGGYFPGRDFTFTWRERVASGEDAGFSLNALLGTSIPPATASPPVVEKGPSMGTALASRTTTADVQREGGLGASEKNGGPTAVVQKQVAAPTRGKVGVKDGGDEAVAEKKGVRGKPGRRDEVKGGGESVRLESEAEKPGVSAFMRSANAEEEWLATKAKLRMDYRRKKRQALRQGRLGQRGLV